MKTVIEMAREAGLHLYVNDLTEDPYALVVERFAELVRADERNSWPAEMEAMERQVNILTDALAEEREACAKVCEEVGQHNIVTLCAAAIRARSNT